MFAKVFITLALVGAIFGAVNAQPVSADPEEDCPLICPALFFPTCGTDGEHFMEFANPCEMKVRNCQMQRAFVKPVVATDLDWCRTEMVNGLESLLAKLGNLDMTKPECLKPCTFNIKPVCMSNGKYRAVADNQCMMDAINCALGNKNIFKVLKNGSC